MNDICFVRPTSEFTRRRESKHAAPSKLSAFKGTPAGYGSYDLLTSVTGCSRQRVYLLPPITPSLSVFLSQVCLKLLGRTPQLRQFSISTLAINRFLS